MLSAPRVVALQAPGWEDRPPPGPGGVPVQALQRQEAACVQQLCSHTTPDTPSRQYHLRRPLPPRSLSHSQSGPQRWPVEGLPSIQHRHCLRKENSASRTSFSKIAFLEWPCSAVRDVHVQAAHSAHTPTKEPASFSQRGPSRCGHTAIQPLLHTTSSPA